MKAILQVCAAALLTLCAVSAQSQNVGNVDKPSGPSAQRDGGDPETTIDVENTGPSTLVKATVKPAPELVNKTVNVWISAVYHGAPYFYNGSSWVPYTGGPYPIAMKNQPLSQLAQLTVAKEADLAAFPGADLYVGYGTTEESMKASVGKLTKVYTVLRKQKWAPKPTR